MSRANAFVKDNEVPFEVYIDSWENTFETVFQSWPDKYYLVDEGGRVLQKSEYGDSGELDGKLLVDPTEVLEKFVGVGVGVSKS